MLILILLVFLILLYFYNPLNKNSLNKETINTVDNDFKTKFYDEIKVFEQYNPIDFINIFKYFDVLNQHMNSEYPCKLEIQPIKDITNSIIDKYHNIYYSLPTKYHKVYNTNYVELDKYLRNIRDSYVTNCFNQGFENITTMSYLIQEKEKPYEKNENYTMILS